MPGDFSRVDPRTGRGTYTGRPMNIPAGLEDILAGPQQPRGLKGLIPLIPKILAAIGSAYGDPSGLQYIEGQEAKRGTAQERLFDKYLRVMGEQRARTAHEAEYGEGGLSGLRRRQLEGALERGEATPMPGSPEEIKRARELAEAGRAPDKPFVGEGGVLLDPNKGYVPIRRPAMPEEIGQAAGRYTEGADYDVASDRAAASALEGIPVRAYEKPVRPDTSVNQFDLYLGATGGDPNAALNMWRKDQMKLKAAGVSEREYQRWLSDPMFREYLKTKRMKVYSPEELSIVSRNLALREFGLDSFRMIEDDLEMQRKVEERAEQIRQTITALQGQGEAGGRDGFPFNVPTGGGGGLRPPGWE